MKKTFLPIAGLLLLLYLLPPILPSAKAHSSNVTLEEIPLDLNGQTLKEWYDDAVCATCAGHNTLFGAYVTLPIGDELYIGFGSARPGENDGAYLAKLEIESNGAVTLTGIAELDEQGAHEMLFAGTLLHIAGTDPTGGDGHDAGNHYTYDPTDPESFTKYRDNEEGLVNVFHTWGLWLEDDVLYAAASGHDGNYSDSCDTSICMGKIFTTTNNGLTWTLTSELGGYRAYDITGFNGALYAIYNDAYQGALTLTKSIDGGLTWSPVTDGENNVVDNLRRVHMVELNNELLTVSFDRRSIHALDTEGNVTAHTLPLDYRVGTHYTGDAALAYTDYKSMVVVEHGNTEYLYLIAEQGLPDQVCGIECAIIRTSDFTDWEQMVTTNERLISLSYWPAQEWLVASSSGEDATLWYVDLSGNPTAISLTAIAAAAPAPFPVILLLATGLLAGSALLLRSQFTRRSAQPQRKIR